MLLDVITGLINSWKWGRRKAVMKTVSLRWQIKSLICINTFRELQPPLHPSSVLGNIACFSKVLFSLTLLIPFLPCFDTCIYLFVAPLNLVLAGEHSPKVSCRTCMFSLWFRAVKVLQDPNKSCFCVFPSNCMNFHHELVLVITVWILETVRKGGVLIEGSIYCALCQVYPSHIFFQPGSPLH